MTNILPSLSKSTIAIASDRNPSLQQRLAIALLVLAGCTLCLMALGSATRVMNAGLSCPDWPLCYGGLLPTAQMNLQVFLEWFHRLVAATIGFGLIFLSAIVLRFRTQLPQWLPWSMGLALGLVIFQGILGGLTVTELLRFDIVTAHLGTGLAFFSTLLSIGLSLLTYQPVGNAYSLRWVGFTAASLVYLQSLLGALVASQWALHQCFGQAQLCAVMNRHIVGVFPATIATLILLIWSTLIHRKTKLHKWLSRSLRAIAALLILQLGLGLTTFHLHLQVELLTVLHQAVGAALLGGLITCTVFSFREQTLSI
jgi:heme a synthase